MLPSIRMSKESLFPTCNIVVLRRMQIEDPDNQVSYPTDLSKNLASNRFLTMIDIVNKCWRADILKFGAPRSESSLMFCSWNDDRSVDRIQRPVRSGTCGLVHKPSLEPIFQLCLKNSANPRWLHCSSYVPSVFHGFCIAKAAAGADGQYETQDFS